MVFIAEFFLTNIKLIWFSGTACFKKIDENFSICWNEIKIQVVSSLLMMQFALSLCLLFQWQGSTLFMLPQHPLSALMSLKPISRQLFCIPTYSTLSVFIVLQPVFCHRSLGRLTQIFSELECWILVDRKFFIHESISCLRLRVTMMDWSFNGRCHEIKPTDSLFFTGFVFSSLNIWLLSDEQCAALKDKNYKWCLLTEHATWASFISAKVLSNKLNCWSFDSTQYDIIHYNKQEWQRNQTEKGARNKIALGQSRERKEIQDDKDEMRLSVISDLTYGLWTKSYDLFSRFVQLKTKF